MIGFEFELEMQLAWRLLYLSLIDLESLTRLDIIGPVPLGGSCLRSMQVSVLWYHSRTDDHSGPRCLKETSSHSCGIRHAGGAISVRVLPELVLCLESCAFQSMYSVDYGDTRDC